MATDPVPTIDDIARELYVLPPDEFTTARSARAKALDDDELAKQVRALRKPLLAAWIVNVFAAEQRAELDGALELAAELRAAQEELDAATLSALGRQRRALVRSLAAKAADFAEERGERVTTGTREAVEQTLNAAMFDPDAAAAVASGRLVRPLAAAGVGAVDVTDAVAGTAAVSEAETRPPSDELQARRERKQAERAVRAAEEELERARRDRDEIDRRGRLLQERATDQADRERRLRAELERVRKEARQTQQELGELETRRAAAAGRLTEVERALDDARARLDR